MNKRFIVYVVIFLFCCFGKTALSQIVKSIANPEKCGYVDAPIIYNNNLYMRFQTMGPRYVLAEFDGEKIRVIPNPDNGIGYLGHPVIFNNKLYLLYESVDRSQHLAVFDAGIITLISNPIEGSIVYSPNLSFYDYPLAANNKLYFPLSGPYPMGHVGPKEHMGEFDGAKINSFSMSFFIYFKDPVKYLNKLYLPYAHDQHGAAVALYDEGKVTFIYSPQQFEGQAKSKYGVLLDCFVFKSELYVIIGGTDQEFVFKYNGKSFTQIHAFDYLFSSYNEILYQMNTWGSHSTFRPYPSVINDKLYVLLNSGIGEWDGNNLKVFKAGNISLNPYQKPFVFNNKLYVETGGGDWAVSNGNEFTIIPGSYNENLAFVHNNRVYLRNGSRLSMFDGVKFEMVSVDPELASKSYCKYWGLPIEFKNKLYLKYETLYGSYLAFVDELPECKNGVYESMISSAKELNILADQLEKDDIFYYTCVADMISRGYNSPYAVLSLDKPAEEIPEYFKDEIAIEAARSQLVAHIRRKAQNRKRFGETGLSGNYESTVYSKETVTLFCDLNPEHYTKEFWAALQMAGYIDYDLYNQVEKQFIILSYREKVEDYFAGLFHAVFGAGKNVDEINKTDAYKTGEFAGIGALAYVTYKGIRFALTKLSLSAFKSLTKEELPNIILAVKEETPLVEDVAQQLREWLGKDYSKLVKDGIIKGFMSKKAQKNFVLI